MSNKDYYPSPPQQNPNAKNKKKNPYPHQIAKEQQFPIAQNNQNFQPAQVDVNNKAYQQANQIPNNDFLAHEPDLSNANGIRLFGDKNIMGFIKIVFGILAFQFSITSIFVAMSMGIKPLADYQQSRASLWTWILAAVISIVLLYALGCYTKVARSVPTNYILLSIFTVCLSWIVSGITVYYEPIAVLIAALTTATLVIGLTLYAVFTKRDFVWYLGFLWSMSLVL